MEKIMPNDRLFAVEENGNRIVVQGDGTVRVLKDGRIKNQMSVEEAVNALADKGPNPETRFPYGRSNV